MSKLNAMKVAVTSKAGRSLLKVQKNSPALLFGAGVVGFVGTVVLSSKATLKLDDILSEHEDKVIEARETVESNRQYSASDFTKDSAVLKGRLYKDVAKLYAPTIVVGLATLGCFGSSHVILTRRNAGLMAAYTALDRANKEYRKRVSDLIGEEEEQKLHLESDLHQIQGEPAVDADGKPIPQKYKASQYAKFFSKQSSTAWDQHPEYNLVFLRAQQQYANDLLQARGHIFLNEVYDSLGLDRTPAGQVVGWVKGNGDNYVDFGIFTDKNRNQFHDFMTGREGEILLDFNVDGSVYDLI